MEAYFPEFTLLFIHLSKTVPITSSGTLQVHRRLLHDDDYGVYEALNETAFGVGQVARGRHLVVLGSQTDSPTAVAQQRQLSLRQMVLAPWVLLAPTQLTLEQWSETYKTQVI